MIDITAPAIVDANPWLKVKPYKTIKQMLTNKKKKYASINKNVIIIYHTASSLLKLNWSHTKNKKYGNFKLSKTR